MMKFKETESDTRANLIDPALTQCGWGKDLSRIHREHRITDGRISSGGKRNNAVFADYVFTYKNNDNILAVLEAKKSALNTTEGVQQAKDYAGMLGVRFAYASNGETLYEIDRETGAEQDLGSINNFPSPDELWQRTYGNANEWIHEFLKISFEDGGKGWKPRYYQHNAITKALEAIAQDKKRILLTLATGTGKTAIAFQIVWKLFHAKWSLSTEQKRKPRVLFLADRNILANQAYNSFSAFAEDARVRISADEVRKTGKVPLNGSIFFTIFQTFMTNTTDNDDDGIDDNVETACTFHQYPADFFDLVIVDECHRGGAKDESTWREILEYFNPAVQIGLTATPKREINADTYAYFGEPVYTYPLKKGIADGFLTPFRVRRFSTTVDRYTYSPDDEVVQGEIEQGKTYTENHFNRKIYMEARERIRVQEFMSEINANDKTLVFCRTQEHAGQVRDLINQEKSKYDIKNPNYCVRVTAQDGDDGDQYLRHFQDNERIIPTILTTSKKLSTGVDARNVRNIVLMRSVNSMIEFKQIIGRGTRLFEGKDYFTIYDFVNAHENFSDPEWDGEPEPPEAPQSSPPMPDSPTNPPDDCPHPTEKKEKIIVKLSDGKERAIQSMSATSFMDGDGKMISGAQFIEVLYGKLPELFKDEDQLRQIWGHPETRKELLQALENRGISSENLKECAKLIQAEKSDVFDVLAYVAYELTPTTRAERVSKNSDVILGQYDEKLQTFLKFVLEQYKEQGVDELSYDKLPRLIEIKYGTPNDARDSLGVELSTIRGVFTDFQKNLYAA